MDDLCVDCSEMNVSKSEQNCINSDEAQLILRYNEPFFMKFELFEPFALTLSFWKDCSDSPDKFMRVLVGRKAGNGKFTYVASKLEAFYQQLYLECPEMNAGKYYVMLMVNGPTDSNLDVKFFHYKKLKGQLTNIDFKPCNRN